jgi:PAT family beta-lactamase induction signal transducer AmpG
MLSAVLFLILAWLSSLHDISSDGLYLLTLTLIQQYRYVGLRICAYQLARLFCQGGLVALVGWLTLHSTKLSAWRIIFIILSFCMLLLICIHWYTLPHTESHPQKNTHRFKHILVTTKNILQEWNSLPSIALIIIFIVLYNAADAQLMRIVPLFFMDNTANHGLAMSNFSMAIAQTIGISAMIVGAFALSFCLHKLSLRTTLRGATLLLFIANSGYLSLTLFPQPVTYIAFFIYGIAQFMFGFCNSAYMAFLMQQAGHRTYQAAYYALVTAVMSLSFLMFGLVSGYLQKFFHYQLFFLWIIVVGAVTLVFTYYFTNHYMRTT